MTRISRAAALAAALLVVAVPSAAADPVTYTDAAAFRAAVGTDRMEINWDDVAPGALSRTHYQAATGALLDSNGPFNALTVRAAGDYPAFSAPNVVTSDGTTTDVTFTVPGTSRPAGVNAFGVALTDVDTAGSFLALYDQFGARIGAATAATGATSFVGIRLDPGVHAVRARIIHGTAPADGGPEAGDEVALDDLVFARPVQPRLSISDVTITEGDDGTADAVFTVTRAVDTSSVLVVPYATLSDGAREGDDYNGKTGTIAFNKGVTTRTIEVAVRGDRADELDEAFRVLLLDDGQADLADPDGRAVILDNDPPVVVTATPTPTPTPPAPAPAGYDPAKDNTLPRIRAGGIPRKKCTRKDFVARINVTEDGLATLRIRLDRKYISDRATTAAVVERLRLRVPAKALKRGKHTLRISARDRAGNQTARTFRFRRC